MIVPLLIGAVLAACALAFVLTPLLLGPFRGSRLPARGDSPGSRRDAHVGDGASGEVTAVDVLREIEFDRATGKLSDADYGSLKSAYTARALVELRAPSAEPRAGDPTPAASITSRGTTPSLCSSCGAGTVADAAYCIECGHYLTEQCPDCGAAITMAAARYCGACGGPLAASAAGP